MFFSPLSSKKPGRFRINYPVKDEDKETLEWEINSEIIRYIFKEVITNSSMEVPNESTLQEAADLILGMVDFVEEVRCVN